MAWHDHDVVGWLVCRIIITHNTGAAAASPTSASSYQTFGSEPSLLNRTPEDVIIFAYERLHYGYSAAVRHAAAQVLGVLSRHFLVCIAGLFSDGLAKAKTVSPTFDQCPTYYSRRSSSLFNDVILEKQETEQREFASYQQAIKFVDFGVGQGTSHIILHCHLFGVKTSMFVC
jgi:hypothetical protein